MIYQVGRTYKIVSRNQVAGYWKVGDIFIVTSLFAFGKTLGVTSADCSCSTFYIPYYECKLIGDKPQEAQQERGIMNKSILAVYERTADAVLVDKHMGGTIGTSAYGTILLKSVKEPALTECIRLEREANKK